MELRAILDANGNLLHVGKQYTYSTDGQLIPFELGSADYSADPLADQAKAYPAYWREIPSNWEYLDTYRVGKLFPLADDRLIHARKKLLVPGIRTGGKSVFKDVKEARDTLTQWMIDNPEK